MTTIVDPIPPRHLLAALGVEVDEIAGAPALRFPGLAAALPGGVPVYDPAAEDATALRAYVEALHLADAGRAEAWRPFLAWVPEAGAWIDLRPTGEADDVARHACTAPLLPDYLATGLGIVQDEAGEALFPGWCVATGKGAVTYLPRAESARAAALAVAEGLAPRTVADLRAWRPLVVWRSERGRWDVVPTEYRRVGLELCRLRIRRRTLAHGRYGHLVGRTVALAGLRPGGYLVRDHRGRLADVPETDATVELGEAPEEACWELTVEADGTCEFRRAGRPLETWRAKDPLTAARYAEAIVRGGTPATVRGEVPA